MQLFGLAGWKRSGKTELMTRLIPVLGGYGLRVSAVKEARHDFDIDQPGKDSFLHRVAGASEVMLASSHRWALMQERRARAGIPRLAEILERLTPVDLVLVEGFRHEGHRKIEIHRASIGKKLLFSTVATVVFFAVVEAVLALAGWKPIADDDDPYVGFFSINRLFVESGDGGAQAELATAKNKLRWFNEQRFPRQKPPGVFRIFCLGGSTTYGRPYDDATSFAGWLRALLPAADDSRRWEVINAGGIINVANEYYGTADDAQVMAQIAAIGPRLLQIFEQAARTGRPTNAIADDEARRLIGR